MMLSIYHFVDNAFACMVNWGCPSGHTPLCRNQRLWIRFLDGVFLKSGPG